jgi:hypothetical protein
MFLDNPMILARLWEAHGFSPRYKVRPKGNRAIHLTPLTTTGSVGGGGRGLSPYGCGV